MTKTTVKMVLILGVLAVLIVSVAGCTSSSNSSQTPSSTTSATTQRNTFLENFLAAYKNETYYSDNNTHVQAWELDWINSTSARVQLTELNKTANLTINVDETLTVFPTTPDATNYVNAMNLTAYSLASTEYTGGGDYVNVTGHAPQVYKGYQYVEGSSLNISEYKLHEIRQLDNLVVVQTGKILS